MKKINVLCILNGYIPSVTLGLVFPLLELKNNKLINAEIVDIRLTTHNALLEKISSVDVVCLCRSTLPEEEIIIRVCNFYEVPILYEVDDNFFEIPLTTPVGRFHRNPLNLTAHKLFIQQSSLTRVYSKKMYQLVKELGGVPYLAKTYFDFSLVDDYVKPTQSNIINIGYPTARLDDPRIESIIFDLIRRVSNKHGKKIMFHMWNNNLPKDIKNLPNVKIHKQQKSYKKFIETLKTLRLDIGLAPLVDLPFFHSKTENKFREFGALGIAGIYSNCPPYNQIIKNQQHGLLAEFSLDSWTECLESLINDPKLRGQIASQGFDYATKNYQFSDAVIDFFNSIKKTLELFKPDPACVNYKLISDSACCAINIVSASKILTKSYLLIPFEDEFVGFNRFKNFSTITNSTNSITGSYNIFLIDEELSFCKITYDFLNSFDSFDLSMLTDASARRSISALVDANMSDKIILINTELRSREEVVSLYPTIKFIDIAAPYSSAYAKQTKYDYLYQLITQFYSASRYINISSERNRIYNYSISLMNHYISIGYRLYYNFSYNVNFSGGFFKYFAKKIYGFF